jgi:hypothetical protein
MNALVTDLDPEKVAKLGWVEIAQHASTLELSYYPDVVSRELFDRHVTHRFVDMNHIPRMEPRYDFCWSVCAMEHLGSIQRGLDLVENSLGALKPGGLAIHTTEFNFSSQHRTIEISPSTVLFLRKHFERLADRLSLQGHSLLGPDFDLGNGFLDRYIDLPPFGIEGDQSQVTWRDTKPAHLKLAIGPYACTCFGIIVRKGGAPKV